MIGPLALLACVLLLVGGCGGGGEGGESATSSEQPQTDPRAAVEATVTSYYDALAAQDATAACEQLTPDGQGEVVKYIASTDRSLTGAGCEEAIKAFYFSSDDVDFDEVRSDVLEGEVTIDGDAATITAKHRLGLRLAKDGDRWKLASLGLEPQVSLDELTAAEGVELARANLAIAKFCVEELGYLTGVEDSPPSPARLRAKDAAVDTLERMASDAPDAKTSDGVAMRDVLLEQAANLDSGGCDTASARQLTRAANALP